MNKERAIERINQILRIKSEEEMEKWIDIHFFEFDENFFKVFDVVISKESINNPSLANYLKQFIPLLKEAKPKKYVELINDYLKLEKESDLENWIEKYSQKLDNTFFQILDVVTKKMQNQNIPTPDTLQRLVSLQHDVIILNKPVKTIHILGAGFSHSAGFPLCANLLNELDKFMQTEYEVAVNKVHPRINLMADFFTSGVWASIRNELINSEMFESCISTDSDNFLTGNIEEVLDIVDNKIIPHRSSNESGDFESTQSRWRFGLVSCLAFYFRWRCQQLGERGFEQAGAIIFYILNFVKPGDTLISFNYDFTVEHVLYSAKVLKPISSIIWTRGDGYGFDQPQQFLSVGSEHADEFSGIAIDDNLISVDCQMGSNVKLLYLHGSALWAWDSENSRLITEGGLMFHKVRPTNEEIIDSWRPLLAEPRMKKPIHIGVLSDIWNTAEKSLMDAEQIIIIGYSFPAADGEAEKMIKYALDNTNVEIIVLDPTPRSDHRIVKLYAERVKYLQLTLEQFVERLFLKNRKVEDENNF